MKLLVILALIAFCGIVQAQPKSEMFQQSLESYLEDHLTDKLPGYAIRFYFEIYLGKYRVSRDFG